MLVHFIFSLYVLLQLDLSGGETVSLSLASYNSLKNFCLGLEDCILGLGLEGSRLVNIPDGLWGSAGLKMPIYAHCFSPGDFDP